MCVAIIYDHAQFLLHEALVVFDEIPYAARSR